MNHILKCRRTFLGFFAICCLTFLGWYCKTDVGGSIAMVCLGVAGANAAQKVMEKKSEPKA